MICPSCNFENEPGRKFCGECGTRLTFACPSCGTPNSPGTKFCGECGTSLSEPAPASQATSALATAAAVSAPTAERRLVTVLFADLVGFTTLAEDRDAEETRDLLNRYFEGARGVIARYGGTVEKFIGDAVMAVWGTPTAHEDDAERAVRAGLDLVETVSALGAELGVGLAIRAGILTGEAAVTLGAEGQGMVAGDLVNTASRLQSMAPPGIVLVGEATQRSASDAIAFEPVGEQQLKGKALPVAAWRALRVVAMRKGEGRAGVLEPPFVGRDEELHLLKQLLEVTGREQRPRLVSITGAAGIGKSRLAWEFRKYIDGVVEVIYWHEGRSPSYGEGVTFWALGEMVRQRAGIAETDGTDLTRSKLQETVAEYVTDEDERRWIEPRLAGLLGVEPMPPGEREELFAAWRTFFERVSEKGTTVLVFEDLHWADAGLLDFVEHLLEWSRGRAILVVTLARPELFDRRPTWGTRQKSFSAVHLDPMPAASMRSLVEGMAPGIPEALVARIVERAEGVPLYAVELVRMLVADGQLVSDDGQFRATGGVDDLPIPASLQGLLAARLDALDPADRGMLQTAAVLGQSFTLEALTAVSGAEPDTVTAALDRMAQSELLALDADPRSPERGQFRFLQGLTREVAVGMLARPERRSRHLAAARYYEHLGDDELAGVLASHYVEAHRAAQPGPEAEALAAQARIALRAAADRAASLHSHEQALAYVEHALAFPGGDIERAQLWERAAESARALGRYEEGAGHASRALELYRGAGDRAAWARSVWSLGVILSNSGQGKRAVEVLEGALSEHPDVDAEPEFAAILAELGRAYLMSSQAAGETPLLETVERALILAERHELIPVITHALITRGTMLGIVGRPREGIALLRSAAQMATDAGDGMMLLRALGNLAFLEYRDDPHATRSTAELGMSEARRLGEPAELAWHAANWLNSCLDTGEWQAGIRRGAEILSETGESGARYGPILGSLSLLQALSGDSEAGRATFARAESTMAGVTDPQMLQGHLDLRAFHSLAEGRLVEACDLWLEVAPIADANPMAMASWAARVALWLADRDRHATALAELEKIADRGRFSDLRRREARAAALALAGQRPEAAAAFRETVRLARELEMPIDLAFNLAALAAVIGPASAEGGQAVAESERILEQVGAPPLLAMLRERLPVVAQALGGRSGATEGTTQTETLARR